MDPRITGLLLGTLIITVFWFVGLAIVRKIKEKGQKHRAFTNYEKIKTIQRITKDGKLVSEFLSWRYDIAQSFIAAVTASNGKYDPEVDIIEIVVLPGKYDHLQYVSDEWKHGEEAIPDAALEKVEMA